jgi:hypothetical protein
MNAKRRGRDEEAVMRLNENARFIFLTLGVFCLTLGAAVLLLSLIGQAFFAMSFVGLCVGLSSIATALGAILLLFSRRRSR